MLLSMLWLKFHYSRKVCSFRKVQGFGDGRQRNSESTKWRFNGLHRKPEPVLYISLTRGLPERFFFLICYLRSKLGNWGDV